MKNLELNKLSLNEKSIKTVFHWVERYVLSSDLQGEPQSSKGTLFFDLEVSKAKHLEEYSQSSRWASYAENLA